GGAAALARTLFLEHPEMKVTVVDVPLEHPKASEWVAAEANAASGLTEAHYDQAGVRRQPRLKLLWPDSSGNGSCLGPEDLLLVTLGCIVGQTGLRGEAHYGLANEWLGSMVCRWQQQHPNCRCLNLDWSVWAGAGMGQRLGVLDSLVHQGITPLPLEDAINT